MFINHHEYVGGADGLVPIYEQQFSTTVNTRCPGCFGAMLIDVGSRILEYERNLQSLSTSG